MECDRGTVDKLVITVRCVNYHRYALFDSKGAKEKASAKTEF